VHDMYTITIWDMRQLAYQQCSHKVARVIFTVLLCVIFTNNWGNIFAE